MDKQTAVMHFSDLAYRLSTKEGFEAVQLTNIMLSVMIAMTQYPEIMRETEVNDIRKAIIKGINTLDSLYGDQSVPNDNSSEGSDDVLH